MSGRKPNPWTCSANQPPPAAPTSLVCSDAAQRVPAARRVIGGSMKVTFEKRSYPREAGESVLDCLIRGGANVSFSCRKGTCQVCLLRSVDGPVDLESRRGLRAAAVEAGLFLPCLARPNADVSVERPDPSQLFVRLHLAERKWLSESVCAFSFEPETQFNWRAGQFINLRREDGLCRSYSIASDQDEDYYLVVHVKRIANGAMSNYLCNELMPGATVEAHGPLGACYYDASYRQRDMLLLATGSGLSPIWGILKSAFRQGHSGRVVLYHGARVADGLYLRDELAALQQEHRNFEQRAFLTQTDVLPEGISRGRIVEAVRTDLPNLTGWLVFAAGIPSMVEEARCQAVLSGVIRADIYADPFEYAQPYMPNDAGKIAATPSDPELWEALGKGTLLNRILQRFYDRAFEDNRLSPFFHKITKQRAIEQQYAFLADLISGGKKYFGLRPFNAHHWMVISDNLFDYREAMIEQVMREEGLAEPYIRRWSALHERFRREIVKAAPRGMIVNGLEQSLKPPERITADCASLCDGCASEIPAGASATFYAQTGQLFCARCAPVP